MGYLVGAVVILSRTWYAVCNVPLHVHAVVAAVLMLPLVVLTWMSNFMFGMQMRVGWTISAAIVTAWSLVGLSWVVQSSSPCRTAAPQLFGLAICFVVLFFIPCLLLLFYCGFQTAMYTMLQRGSVYGNFWPWMLSGNRPPRSGQLGVTVLGQSATGKTSLLRGLMTNIVQVFPPDGKCKVIDDSPSRYTVKANRITYNEEDATSMRITDLVNADCVVLCFSLLDRRSFHSIRRTWLPHAVAHSAVPIVLVGTHADRNLASLPFRPIAISSLRAPVHQGTLDPPSAHVKFCASNLTTSLVLRIFSYLPNGDLVRAQLVCKLWAELGRHPFVWKARSAGQVEKRDVRAWMRLVAAQGLLKNSGFPRIAAYREVDCTAQDPRSMISVWRQISHLAQLNETKLYVARAQEGELLFSRRPFEKGEGIIE